MGVVEAVLMKKVFSMPWLTLTSKRLEDFSVLSKGQVEEAPGAFWPFECFDCETRCHFIGIGDDFRTAGVHFILQYF